MRRLLTLSPDHEPLLVRLYVHQIESIWAAIIVGKNEMPPEPGELKGLAFLRGHRRRGPTGGEEVFEAV